jgi:hypothetical protein
MRAIAAFLRLRSYAIVLMNFFGGFDAGARHYSLVRWHVAWLLLDCFYPHPDYGHHIS